MNQFKEEFQMFEDDSEESVTHPGEVDQMNLIGELLKESSEYNLDPEVIYYALKAMKENSELEPYEAFAIGHSEWIK